MLAENDIQRMWRQLFRGQPITSVTLSEAENLLAELRQESPLLVRLSTELGEIRKHHEKSPAGTPSGKPSDR